MVRHAAEKGRWNSQNDAQTPGLETIKTPTLGFVKTCGLQAVCQLRGHARIEYSDFPFCGNQSVAPNLLQRLEVTPSHADTAPEFRRGASIGRKLAAQVHHSLLTLDVCTIWFHDCRRRSDRKRLQFGPIETEAVLLTSLTDALHELLQHTVVNIYQQGIISIYHFLGECLWVRGSTLRHRLVSLGIV